MERREVSSRSNRLIRAVAGRLASGSVTPNQISVASVVFSLMVPAGLFFAGGLTGSLAAIIGVQLRLLANVLDGLVAVEGGKSTPLGALYNEFPDRIADTLILVSIGYAAQTPALGWACALLAALTAYVRVFGGSLGQPQIFSGPMAKQHRMAVASVALLGHAFLAQAAGLRCLQGALWLMLVGCVVTCAARTRAIALQVRGGHGA
jgi:phosphatidylglycerophosphate synthase